MMTVCKDQLLTHPLISDNNSKDQLLMYPLISDDDSVLGPTVNVPPD